MDLGSWIARGALIIFSFSFFLAVQLPIWRIPHGLKVHHWAGILAVLLAWLHVGYEILDNAPYTDPSLYPGWLAFLSLNLLVALSFAKKIEFSWWRRLHLFLILAFGFATYHAYDFTGDHKWVIVPALGAGASIVLNLGWKRWSSR